MACSRRLLLFGPFASLFSLLFSTSGALEMHDLSVSSGVFRRPHSSPFQWRRPVEEKGTTALSPSLKDGLFLAETIKVQDGLETNRTSALRIPSRAKAVSSSS